ncbi:hypothetical protein Dsin_029084 [Dipteronia sinensis]|uniref:DUF4283 domain-containing protein n=1 Tax=Dipteronia sinensis TaxID=43782 RepID=A0AAD9ZRP2_9ROSI|nr:hypothetical protein Dsin_029084 [Dipteronia sinensis]
MDAEDIAAMCASLSLSEQERESEGPVQRLEGNLKSAAMHRMSLCVVGKVLSNKKVNWEAFMRVIRRIWQVDKGLDIESVTRNMFTFHFRDEDDMSRVISGSPWSFDDALIALERPSGKGTVKSLGFNWADFWVQIHQVPLLCMSKDIGWFLGGMIGDVMDVDGGAAGDCVGKFIRIRVRINIKKPLKRWLRVDVLGDGSETVMVLRYERLPNHCFKCGMVDHVTNAVGTFHKTHHRQRPETFLHSAQPRNYWRMGKDDKWKLGTEMGGKMSIPTGKEKVEGEGQTNPGLIMIETRKGGVMQEDISMIEGNEPIPSKDSTEVAVAGVVAKKAMASINDVRHVEMVECYNEESGTINDVSSGESLHNSTGPDPTTRDNKIVKGNDTYPFSSNGPDSSSYGVSRMPKSLSGPNST